MRFFVFPIATLAVSVGLLPSVVMGQNQPPAQPTFNEPRIGGHVVASDVHMECSNFADPNPGDLHLCTDWEIWTVEPHERVWVTSCIGGVERLHTHLGDGVFENSHVGRHSLWFDTHYLVRVRHRDNSGQANDWGPWGERGFVTAAATQINPMEVADVASTPIPMWDHEGEPVVLPVGTPAASLTLESATGELLLRISAVDGVTNEIVNPAPLVSHSIVRLRVSAGGAAAGIVLPDTNLHFTGEDGEQRTIYLPTLSLSAGTEAVFWVAISGATYIGNASQQAPDFTTLARSAPVPWFTQPGYRIDVVASGFSLPVNIAFVPEPGLEPDSPLFYVTELYGTIKVVLRNGTVQNFATNLVNYPPTGNFPGSGEQGLTGIAVERGTHDVYASMLYEAAGGFHFPKVVRFVSNDGGRTAAGQVTVLDMFGEHQGQSHQISNVSFGPDGMLYVHMGDGFRSETPLDPNSFRGKILRLNTDGSAPSDNPFYDASNGINARDYTYALGFRNPFGGGWRLSDGRHYEVENGPSVDRLARVDRGDNYGYDGTDPSMYINALHNWSPPTAPVNITFVEPGRFGGSGFPADRWGHAFVSLSGPTWLQGVSYVAKQISEFVIDDEGFLVGELPYFVRYVGAGYGTVCGLAAGPDGLYFSDLYEETGAEGPIAPGANILRVRYVGSAAFYADVRRGPGPLTVAFTDESSVPGAHTWEWDFGDGGTSIDRHPVHVYQKPGVYNVRLSVSGVGAPVVTQRNSYITVSNELRIAYLGGGSAPFSADAQAIAALTQNGFIVDYFEDDGPGRPTGDNLARDRNLVIISSSIAAPGVLMEFRDVATPVMFWEQTLLFPQFESLAGGATVARNQNALNIINDTHPITHGMKMGRTIVTNSPAAFNIARPAFAPGAQILIERDGVPGEVALMTVDTAQPLLDNRRAAARRAFFWLDDVTFPLINATGRELFDRTVCWATGLGAEIAKEPQDVSTHVGRPATFTAYARGVGPFTYQWRKDGALIKGATNPELFIEHVTEDDEGVYEVTVANSCGSDVSQGAALIVACGGDYNLDGMVNTQDLFDFFACFFEQGCVDADINFDGIVNSQDFFDFLPAFFAGCD